MTPSGVLLMTYGSATTADGVAGYLRSVHQGREPSAGLVAEFSARKPEDPAGTWYTPDQTVGFCIGRMAQETVIHRIDWFRNAIHG